VRISRPVESAEGVHFLRRELLGDCAHLFEDIVLAAALCEFPELAFDVGGVLPLERRRAELEAAGAMTDCTRRNAALRIAGVN
jgi:hypothetical protein